MKHLQSLSQLLFDVFAEYEPDNLLYRQVFEEMYRFQLERGRLRKALERIKDQSIVVHRRERLSPIAFPIVVDRLREKMTSETLEQRVRRLQKQMDKE